LSELILLNTGLDGLVELSIKDTLRDDADLVVRLNILLDRLAAVVEIQLVACSDGRGRLGRQFQRRRDKTPNIPATIALLQL
jgi:hypothetical protein